MTKRKLINREELLNYKVGVRFDEKTYNKLKSWVGQSNASSIGELVRKIVTKEKITFFVKDVSMEELTAELIRIRKEINAMGRNINQLTEAYHTTNAFEEKDSHVVKAVECHQRIADKISEVWKRVTEMSAKWSAK
jgi:hypothetical protein